MFPSPTCFTLPIDLRHSLFLCFMGKRKRGAVTRTESAKCVMKAGAGRGDDGGSSGAVGGDNLGSAGGGDRHAATGGESGSEEA